MKKLALLVIMVVMPLMVYAEEEPAANMDTSEQDRAALRQILSDIEASINAMDFDKLFTHFDEKITINFMTTDVATGKDEILAFYNKMFKDDGAPLESLKTKASLGAPAVFHGDTITAYGRAEDTYQLKSGDTHRFDTRWTATAIKKNNQWKVATINFSVNPLSNPILDELTDKLGMFTTLAFVIGILIAFIIARFSRKKSA